MNNTIEEGKKKEPSKSKFNPKLILLILAVVVLIFGIYGISYIQVSNPHLVDYRKESNHDADSSDNKFTMSDVAGHWVGTVQGFTAMDVVLSQNGSIIWSHGDFGTDTGSHGKSWHISNGNTVVIDLGDGGSTILFSYTKWKVGCNERQIPEETIIFETTRHPDCGTATVRDQRGIRLAPTIGGLGLR